MDIKTVEMVHKIRDQQYEEMKGLSIEEQVEFIKKKSAELQNRLKEIRRSGPRKYGNDGKTLVV